MTSLSQVLSTERTFIGNFGASKKKVLQTLAERISPSLGDVQEHALFDQLIARERLGSTGIGSGVAVPHCRLEGIDKPIAALVKLDTPIDFEAIDHKPVDLIFVLIVPLDATDEHLQLLANVVERVNNSATLSQIRSCQTVESLFSTFVG
ncbi:PTS sugar transporter subunit IIA [Reinekea sp.]|jgi:PTS system nitrogen regulatory IIA component|uniref:PTS sugar transporter subunit IIA n=1 Tax=Reinekea sp. TaxID=1970455 RepID=UPI003988F15F